MSTRLPANPFAVVALAATLLALPTGAQATATLERRGVLTHSWLDAPMAPSDGNRRLLGPYDRASQDLGLGAVVGVDPSRAGAADVAFIAGIVPMIIDGIGLSGHDDHSDKETADLRMLPVQTKRAALLMLRVSKTPDPVRP